MRGGSDTATSRAGSDRSGTTFRGGEPSPVGTTAAKYLEAVKLQRDGRGPAR